jgi:hypothetical protein
MPPVPATTAAPKAAPASRTDTAKQVGKEAAVSYANRPHKKTSVRGGVAKGAVAGAGTGATLGSIVPGVGTAVGAGVGAAVGGAAGGVSAHREKAAERAAGRGSAQQLLVAEFIVCMILLALSPMSSDKEIAPKDWMKRGSAMCALFLVLGLVSHGSAAVAKVCAAFGGIVTVALLVDQRSVFAVIAEKLKTTGTATPPEEGPPESVGSGLGQAGASAAQAGANYLNRIQAGIGRAPRPRPTINPVVPK